tara:strand:+ start:47 stop:448 length:402 start_codon:yes stop_codon:yes gene_type:complete
MSYNKFIDTKQTKNGILTLIVNGKEFKKQKNYDTLYDCFSESLGNILEHNKQYNTKIHCVVDLKLVGLKHLDIKFIKKLVDILYNKYPECLEKCIIINPPTFIKMIYDLLKMILDKPTRERIVIYGKNKYNLL